MTSKETKAQHAASEARAAHRRDLDEERKADEAAEAREEAAAARAAVKHALVDFGLEGAERKVGASRVDPAPAPIAASAPEPAAAVKPVVAIAHFLAGEVEAIDAALRDSAKDRAVYVLQAAIKRAMPR
jgi:hypothetical protein